MLCTYMFIHTELLHLKPQESNSMHDYKQNVSMERPPPLGLEGPPTTPLKTPTFQGEAIPGF